MNQFDNIPKDLTTWTESIRKDPTLVPGEKTHHRLVPSNHQLIAVCRIMDLVYTYHPAAETMRISYLANAHGFGKTLVFLLVIAIRRYHQVVLASNDESNRSACCAQYKA
jgi:hypothetical protein